MDNQGLDACVYLSAEFGNAFGAVRDFGPIISGRPGLLGPVVRIDVVVSTPFLSSVTCSC